MNIMIRIHSTVRLIIILADIFYFGWGTYWLYKIIYTRSIYFRFDVLTLSLFLLCMLFNIALIIKSPRKSGRGFWGIYSERKRLEQELKLREVKNKLENK